MREIPHKWAFQARIQNFQIKATQRHFQCMQMNIRRPVYAVSTHNYAPKVAWVMETRGCLKLSTDFKLADTIQFCFSYNASVHKIIGPDLMKRVLVKWCGKKKISPGQDCQGIRIYPEDYFFPVRDRDGMYVRDQVHSKNILNGLLKNDDIRAFHVWSPIKRKQWPADKWMSQDFIWANLTQTHCPVVSRYAVSLAWATDKTVPISWSKRKF
jgi:hypothetical protein